MPSGTGQLGVNPGHDHRERLRLHKSQPLIPPMVIWVRYFWVKV
jgi:hypothetical protein